MKVISARRFAAKTYKEAPFTGLWALSFGVPERNASWLIYGDSGQGKTEFCVQLANYLSNFGSVVYVSAEQGDSRSLQSSWLRNGLKNNKRLKLAYKASSEDLLHLMQARRKPYAIIIDSIDYMAITAEEYKQLRRLSDRTMLIFVSWEEGRKPASKAAKDIRYMADIKVRVRDFVAEPRSRYGSVAPFVIWEEEAKKYHAFLNRSQ